MSCNCNLPGNLPSRPIDVALAKTRESAPLRLALNVKEACAALGVSWDLWKAHIEPDVRLVRIGSRKLVPVSELERWLTENAETVLGRR